jgi:hypothetical protein
MMMVVEGLHDDKEEGETEDVKMMVEVPLLLLWAIMMLHFFLHFFLLLLVLVVVLYM